MSALLLSHVIIYLFSIIGLLLTPKSLDRFRWAFPLWFGIVNALLFSGIWKFNLFDVPAYFIIITQLPWVLVCAYVITAVNMKLLSISLPEWALWSVYRLMGVQYLLWLYGAALPQEYILVTFVLETIVGITCVPLFLLLKHKPAIGWYLTIFWNSLGILSVWRINSIFQKILFTGPANSSQREMLNYYSAFPELWNVCFWIPLALCIHVVIFYGLWKHRRQSV